MKTLAVIPARMGSSRYPGKPMEKIHGIPMIGYVYKRVIECAVLDFVIVATCDQVIYDYITSIGGMAVMTSKSHERASDRCAEAVNILEQTQNTKYDVVVMIQGDEPLISSDMIGEALMPLINNEDVQIVNLMGDIIDESEHQDRNCIKVVTDIYNNALYFSRQPIPTNAVKGLFGKKQICVIPFRRNFLATYTKLKETALEISESIDMLRVLEHGYKIRMVPTKAVVQSVDTPGDLKKVLNILELKK